jgi:hypothetical protein
MEQRGDEDSDGARRWSTYTYKAQRLIIEEDRERYEGDENQRKGKEKDDKKTHNKLPSSKLHSSMLPHSRLPSSRLPPSDFEVAVFEAA